MIRFVRFMNTPKGAPTNPLSSGIVRASGAFACYPSFAAAPYELARESCRNKQKESKQRGKADPGAYTQTPGAELPLNPVVAGRYRYCLKGSPPALQGRASPIDESLPLGPELLVQVEAASSV